MNALTPEEYFGTDVSEEVVFEPHQSTLEQATTLRQLAAFHLAHGATKTADHLSAIAIWLAPDDGGTMRLRAHVLAHKGETLAGLKLLIAAGKAVPGSVRLGDWMTLGMAFARQQDIGYARKLLFRSQAPKRSRRRS